MESKYSLRQMARTYYPAVKIVGMVNNSSTNAAVLVSELQLEGWFSYNTDTEGLGMCINQIASGRTYYSPCISVQKHRRAAQKQGTQVLNSKYFSKREREILWLVCQQYTSREIGRMLNISQRTVDGYRYRLIRKCQVRNTAGLIHFAIRHSLFTAEAELS